MAGVVIAAGSAAQPQSAGGVTLAPDVLLSGGVVSTSGPVVALAADGSRVAVAVDQTRQWCSHVVVWDVSRRGLVPFLPPRCSKPDSSWVDEVALAGARAAWIRYAEPGGNYHYFFVETATVGAPRVRQLSGGEICQVAYCFSETGGEGAVASNTVGHGDLLVLNAYTNVLGAAGGLVIESGELLRVTPAGLRPVVSGLRTLYAVSVDAGRILVLRNLPWEGGEPSIRSSGADGSLAIYRADGRLVGAMRPTLGRVRDARLQGRYTAVLTHDKVGVIDTATGKILRAWGLQSAGVVRLEDIQDGIVVYVVGRTIRLLRLRDGHQASIAVPGRGDVYAQLEASGLFYSYTATQSTGRVAFIRFADLTRRFGD
jgi:hypothetical protein